MKNVLALSISLAMSVAPVLAQTDQASQAANVTAPQTAAALAGPQQGLVVAGSGGGGAATPTTTPPASPGKNLDKTNVPVGDSAKPPASTKKPSAFSNISGKVEGFATGHPAATGMILGGMIGAAGGPATFVIGLALGAVAGDVASWLIHKFKHSS